MPDEVLAEAQRALQLAPNSVGSNAILDDVLERLNRNDEARAAYQRAMRSAQTNYPEFQADRVPQLLKKLASLNAPHVQKGRS